MNILYIIKKLCQTAVSLILISWDIFIFLYCFISIFFKPLTESLKNKRYKFKSIKDEVKVLEKKKMTLMKKVKNLREEVAWSRDYLYLTEKCQDTKYLDEYRLKIEKNWDLAMEDEDSDQNQT